MFTHVMIGTNDIEGAKRFYDAVLGVIGAGEGMFNTAATGHVRLFYRHEGNTFCLSEPINDEPATPANGGTLGFKCDSEAQVQEFYDVAVQHGATPVEAEPGLRNGSTGPVFLAYVRDPDGHKLCALYRPQ